MMAASEHEIGQIVGHVAARCSRIEVPLPVRWFILQAQAGRDAKVMKLLRQRDVCSYSPVITRVVDRRDGSDARKPHLGREIIKPMLPGLIFVADFDCTHEALTDERIDYVEGWLRLGSRFASLSIEEMKLLRDIEAKFNDRGRRFAIEQLVRIKSGRFAHFVGKVERLDSGGRLKVFIDALMSGASLIVDEAQVEPVSQREARATARRPKRKRGMPAA